MFPAKQVASEEHEILNVRVNESRQTLHFGNAALAFESKSSWELARTWLIFNICAIGPFVRHCDKLYALSLRVFGSNLTYFVTRHSFFAHFCAGETVSDILPRMAHLRKLGVGGILDYAAEAKDEEPIKEQPVVDEQSTVGAPLSAKKYVYQGESVCDSNTLIFLDAIRAVKDATPEGFAAIKLSGLGDPVLLERLSRCLTETTRLFKRISGGKEADEDSKHLSFYCIDRNFDLDFATFRAGWRRLFVDKGDDELRAAFNRIDTDGDGIITFLEWSQNLRLSEINGLVRDCVNQGPLYHSALDEEELKLYQKMVSRTTKILDLAQKLGVRVMVDAEWIDIQPAIDHLVLSLQRTYNRGSHPIVFQTYQTYLKQMDKSVMLDLQRSLREGYIFGAKLVRGAYMVSEREKALRRGVESPVCETYEDTETNFHTSIELILRHNACLREKSPDAKISEAEVLVASHNQGSIEHTLRLMEELGQGPENVYFGQLLGMADHVTFTLGANGYKAYKYVPYGPIDEVVPYLLRRTQENSSILGSPGVQEERRMVGAEFLRRSIGA
jgi:proline dehydrogenase